MKLILGAGLAGLSASYHLGHDRCLLLERQSHAFGHISSEQRDGFTWDQGPHVSFTKNDYVRRLFEESVGGEFHELVVRVGNQYHGHWIDHPAQTSLYQVPEPQRSACLASFLQTRQDRAPQVAANYQEWLDRAMGPVFASTFSAIYTQKYWTQPPSALTTEWIGERILYPNEDDVRQGAKGPLGKSMHYISKVRYPKHGGYQSFAASLKRGSRILYDAEVVEVDLVRRTVALADGRQLAYESLVNTMPLPTFINACRDVEKPVRDAAAELACSQLVLVNVAVPHEAVRPEHWMYVYDNDRLSTRINFVEKLSPDNAPAGWSGIQTEVYFSRYRPLTLSPEEIGAAVEAELIEMGLIDPLRFPTGLTTHRHIKLVPWANIIFDHGTAPALDTIWTWLEAHGLQREADDLHPLTDWTVVPPERHRASLVMAGRFGQWKYYWTDDCVLRGKRISEMT